MRAHRRRPWGRGPAFAPLAVDVDVDCRLKDRVTDLRPPAGPVGWYGRTTARPAGIFLRVSEYRMAGWWCLLRGRSDLSRARKARGARRARWSLICGFSTAAASSWPPPATPRTSATRATTGRGGRNITYGTDHAAAPYRLTPFRTNTIERAIRAGAPPT